MAEEVDLLFEKTGRQNGISADKAKLLLEQAGDLKEEDPEQITIRNHEHLLCDQVHIIIQEVLQENPVGFKLQDFQLLSLHCLGSLKNVVLLSPTGSGKMLCAYYGTLVLRKVFEKPKGVGLVNQPLSALMEEKLKNPVIKTGLITMKGDLKISDNSEEAVLTEPEEHFLTGDIGLILGHPESWITNTAKNIIEALRREELIIFSCVDEFQMNLSTHWGKDFRFVKEKQILRHLHCNITDH